MNILPNQPLANYSTMRLGGSATSVVEIHDRQDLEQALSWAQQRKLPTIMIGGGSNIVWQDEGFNGLLLVNRITGYEDVAENEKSHYLTVGSGENWDGVVERSVASGLTGIEALSLVPGTAGATPIQNVGAYGQEISQTLVSLEVYDTSDSQFKTLAASDCGFSYRNSRFKSGPDRGRFFIMSLTLHLIKASPLAPFYPGVESYFDQNKVASPAASDLRQAVIAIRSAKLPDPAIVNNCGSFFANPIVDTSTLAQITADFGPPPNWQTDDGKVKLSAAWLIEQAGFKNFHDSNTGMATWPTQPLVFVNESAKNTRDLLDFRQKILDVVQQKFQITLTQEPELLP